ncbi:MAG: hypothetical protein JXQ72_14310 [Anaerolineae bacterium]|nr:hypothetical protein [Anaerolineae bacterium]
MTKHIIPRYKLMLFYDPAPDGSDDYYNFIMNEMIPAAHEMGLYIFRVFHTLWGDYPLRQAEFVAEDLETIRSVLNSDRWQALETRLLEHSTNFSRKVVRFRPGFQL